MNTMSNEPTSDDLDRLLEANPQTGERLAPRDDIQITLEVPVDATTLGRLTERAEREGKDVEDLMADALRAAASVAAPTNLPTRQGVRTNRAH